MFSKNESQEAASSPAPASKPAPRSSGRSAPSIFSADVIVVGNLHSEGDIQFDGKIEGCIESGSLTVGETAVIKGEVKADNVTVKGRVLGSVRGRQVQLMSSSHVEGDILHTALSVESGAYFDGNCRHAEDPMTGELKKKASSKLAKDDVEEAPHVAAEPLPSALRQKAS